MKRYKYYVGGRLTTVTVQNIVPSSQSPTLSMKPAKRGTPRPSFAQVNPRGARGDIVATLGAQSARFEKRFIAPSESKMSWVVKAPSTTAVIPTENVAVDGPKASELRWMRDKHGMEIVEEGLRGKVLLQVPPETDDRVWAAFEASRELVERGTVGAAHPNFLRVVQRPHHSSEDATTQWALDNPGKQGRVGADVHAFAAWTITKGAKGIRVAVLDEGVDTSHPYLRNAVAKETDFVEDNLSARPDGNDAHGTACSGIIVSQSDRMKGLAPDLSLVAIRIAKSDARGFWIFDDFNTADAIDWAVDVAHADVLSNSWCGGPPVDVIVRAFERAMRNGRRRKGSVVVVAAGNSQTPIGFPGSIPGVLTVGACNQWDERKTKKSKDNENWWGSNYGHSLDLLAPGVQITTTDIQGRRGYTGGLVTRTFNGTSAATPFVAAVAGMILAIKPKLTEDRVRGIINATADPLTKGGKKDRFRGHGRLNAYAALRKARRA